MTIERTNTKGNSRAMQYWLEAGSGRFRGAGEGGEPGSSVATEPCGEEQRIGRQLHEKFRINSGGDGHKTQRGERNLLPDGDDRHRRVARFVQIRMGDHE